MGVQCTLPRKTVVAISTVEFGGLLRVVAGKHVVFFQVVLVGESCVACFAGEFRGVKTGFHVVRDSLFGGKNSVASSTDERGDFGHRKTTIKEMTKGYFR